MADKVPSVKLNSGLEIPAIGLGTYMSKGGEGITAIKKAIDIGYRSIDTAYLYNTESEVGEAVRDKIAEGVVKREDLFIATKLWCTHHDPERVEYACRQSLENLGLDYIDLYIMHFPVSFVYHDDDTPWPKNPDGTQETNDIDYVDTWKAMEKLVDLGLVKYLGVSNFNSEQVERVLKEGHIKPITNQVECLPTFNQKKLIQFCKERDIVVVAYLPLGHPIPAKRTPAFLYDEKLHAIARKHNKTPAQIVLRYVVELGAVPIPKSVNETRLQENINIFDFQLDADDTKIMDSFNSGKRIVSLTDAKKAKHWPFGIEF